MAITVRSLLYDWFGVTLRKPTHQQFINLIDSFWHKSEDAIPIDNVANLPATLAAKADRTYVDGAINAATVGLLDDRGNHDASANAWPASNGSGYGGAILKGDVYFISVGGTLGGTVVGVGDTIRALVDSPAQDGSKWAIMKKEAIASPAVWGGLTGDIGNQTDLVMLLNLFADANLIFELNTTSPTGCLADVTTFTSALIADNPDLVINSYIIDGRFVKVNCRGLEYLSASLFVGNRELFSIKDFSGIKEIFASCFEGTTLVNCSFLFVEKVYDSAFKDCNTLSVVYFPKLQIINDSYAFSNIAVRYLVFPQLLSVGAFSFSHCNNLEKVSLPSAAIFGTRVFEYCTDLEVVVLPSAYRVDGRCFDNCSSLSKVFLPLVIDMGDLVFKECNNLADLVVLQSFSAVTIIEAANGITAKILAN